MKLIWMESNLNYPDFFSSHEEDIEKIKLEMEKIIEYRIKGAHTMSTKLVRGWREMLQIFFFN